MERSRRGGTCTKTPSTTSGCAAKMNVKGFIASVQKAGYTGPFGIEVLLQELAAEAAERIDDESLQHDDGAIRFVKPILSSEMQCLYFWLELLPGKL